MKDEHRMRTWLSARKHVPAGTLTLLEEARRVTRVADARADVRLPVGAAAALKRLEQSEARAFAAFRRAAESGDPIETTAARKGWLAISESLRRYDLAVESDRRRSGELLPRVVIESLLSDFALRWRYLRQPLHDLCPTLAGLSDPKAVWLALELVVKNFTADLLASLRAAPRPFPPWVFDALLRGGSTDVPDDHTLIDRKLHLFQEITAFTAAMTAGEVEAYFAAERKKWESYRSAPAAA